MAKFLLIILSAIPYAFGSTFYISAVATQNLVSTFFWEFIGPVLGTIYYHFLIEEKTFLGRLKIALISGLGLSIGASLAIILKYYLTN